MSKRPSSGSLSSKKRKSRSSDDEDERSPTPAVTSTTKRSKASSPSTSAGKVSSTLNLLGARVGDRLKGRSSGEGVMVEITQGEILPVEEVIRAEVARAEDGDEVSPLVEAACKYLYKDYPTPQRLLGYLRTLLGPGEEPGEAESSKGISRSRSTSLSDPRNSAKTAGTSDPACKFKILQLGNLHEFARESGNLPEMLALLERDDVTSQEVLPLVGNRTLCLQADWYNLVRADVPVKVSEINSDWIVSLDDVRIVNTRSLKESEKEKKENEEKEGPDPVNFVLQGIPIRVTLRPDQRTLEALVRAAVKEENHPNALHFMENLKGMSPTFLKSFLQKLLRLKPRYTEIEPGRRLLAGDAAIVCFLCLAYHRGSFNPEIQKFIRGITDAFKRLAVIIIEDAWVDKAPVVSLLAAALLSSEMTTFWPTKGLMNAALRALKKATNSEEALEYNPQTKHPTESILFARAAKAPESDFGTCYEILKRIGAMPGDLGMLTSLHQTQGTKAKPPKQQEFPEFLPLHFGIDFHCSRGIGYLTGQLQLETFNTNKEGVGFPEIFGWLFKTFTGRNFRRHEPWSEKEKRDLDKVLVAQRVAFEELMKGGVEDEGDVETGMAKTTVTGNEAAAAQGDPAQASGKLGVLTAKIPVGILSSSLGPIPFKDGRQQYLILLNMDDPSERLVMKAPPRDNKDVDLLDVSEDVKGRAAEWMKGRSFTCKSFLLKKSLAAAGPVSASFDEKEGWLLSFEGKPPVRWEDIRREVKIECPVFELPEKDLLLQGVELLRRAFQNPTPRGVSMSRRKELTAKALLDSAAASVYKKLPSQRLLSLLTDAALTGLRKVRFPKPGRDGKQGGDLGSFPFDIEAYRLALRLTLIWPGALRPGYPADFEIPDPLLFTVMWREVMEVCRSSGEENPVAHWRQSFDDVPRALKAHQADAVEELTESRGRFGHFVCMDTGSGKTQIATAFIQNLLKSPPPPAPPTTTSAGVGDNAAGDADDGAGEEREPLAPLKFKYVIWIAPREVLKPDEKGNKSLVQELRKCGVKKIFHCDPVSNKSVVPQPYHFNVIVDDHIRSIPQILAKVASESIIIADEVDRMYAVGTQRTSTALMLAGMAVKVVAMTATMIRNNREDGVAHWMKFAHPCVPITKENWLISMSSVVIKVFDSKIKITNLDHDIAVDETTLRDDEGRTILELLQAAQLWKASQTIYDAMERDCCEYVQELAKNDSVLLVASDSKHQAKLVAALGRRGIRAGTFEQGPDPSYPVVVVRKDQCRGYNWGIRFGVLLEMPYFGNTADRRQMLGRLKRIGQVRPEIRRIMLVPKGSFLARVYSNHLLADMKNAAIEALGKKY